MQCQCTLIFQTTVSVVRIRPVGVTVHLSFSIRGRGYILGQFLGHKTALHGGIKVEGCRFVVMESKFFYIRVENLCMPSVECHHVERRDAPLRRPSSQRRRSSATSAMHCEQPYTPTPLFATPQSLALCDVSRHNDPE